MIHLERFLQSFNYSDDTTVFPQSNELEILYPVYNLCILAYIGKQYNTSLWRKNFLKNQYRIFLNIKAESKPKMRIKHHRLQYNFIGWDHSRLPPRQLLSNGQNESCSLSNLNLKLKKLILSIGSKRYLLSHYLAVQKMAGRTTK